MLNTNYYTLKKSSKQIRFKKMSQKNIKYKTIKTLIGGSAGNILEWYDFALYGYFAPIFAELFFPSEDSLTALISTFGVFAAGYLMRPLGAIIFGHIGDRMGRKKVLVYSVMLMAIPTTLIGFLPTYKQAGIGAPILLTFFRLLQGISVGGEFTGSLSYLVETAPKNRRGFFGSWTNFGANLGILMGSGAGAIISSVMAEESLMTWGWRIPFFMGILVGFAGLFLRKELEEPETFENISKAGKISESPLRESLRLYWKEILTVLGVMWLTCTSFYMIFVYLTTYISSETSIPLSETLEVNTITMVFLLILIPIMGYISDLKGRKPLLITAGGGLVILAYPLFLVISRGSIFHDFIAQIIFAIVISILQAVVPTVLAELFPTKVRMTAMSLGYNIAQALFGGTTPLVCSFLIKETGYKLMPAFYLIFCGLVSLFVYFTLKETYKKEL